LNTWNEGLNTIFNISYQRTNGKSNLLEHLQSYAHCKTGQNDELDNINLPSNYYVILTC